MSSRAVVVVNGSLPDLDKAKALIQAEDVLIAADAGARHLGQMGLTPHVVVGDMDSLTPQEVDQLAGEGVELRRFPREKDETDLELALLEARNRMCRRILIVAGLGSRIDQSLANLYLMMAPELASMEVRMDDGVVEAFWVRLRSEVSGAVGDTVSLLPLMGQVDGIVTHGLKYPLHGESLYPEHSRGISNELSQTTGVIAVTSGILLCVHTRQ